MVGKQNSTILTVSYGTFSCTLEGFDDSFGTMKAIAEYFRDLASDDRYFGAEPPTPDADMLAKIAEQEVSRRVEARSENGGIVLRPRQIEDAAPVFAENPEPVQQPVAKATPAPFVEEDDAFFGGETHGAMLDEDSVAARLQRIREAARANLEQQIDEEERSVDEPEIAKEIVEEFVEEKEDETIVDDLDSLLSDVGKEENEDESTDADLDEAFDEIDDDDLSDVLKLDGDEGDDLAELDNDEDAAELESDDTDENLQALLGRFNYEDDEGFDDVEDFEGDDNTATETVEFEDDDLDYETEDEAQPIQARILHVKGAALQDMENVSEDDLIGYDDDAYEIPENEVDTETLDAIFEDTEDDASTLSPEEEADLMRELAEVEADETSEVFEDGDDEDGDWGDLLDADTEAVVSDEENLFTGDPEEALASAQDLSSLLTDREADGELGRLMAETESQLTEPGHKKRKTTIQHLKAAFAARRADGNELDGKSGNDSVPYREDLEQAVKPRRPVLNGPRKTERLEATQAAPLKLVAAQKIVPDENQSEPIARPTLVKPVRPRRVRGGNAAVAEDFVTDVIAEPQAAQPSVSFGSFAEHMGVEKLPELLEAAASYMAFVEHYEKFSRPQVMTLVREVMGEAYTREDGLRAFGQLLREGKLIRLEGGRFTVSDGIGFQPS